MIKRFVLCLLTLCPACILIAGLSSDNDSHRANKKRFAMKHISKRDGTSCQTDTQYLYNTTTDAFCCYSCDPGLEVETNCTITQNIKCKCLPGFFCDSQPCQHCNPCDKCENGIILEKCTETKDTICQRKENVLWWHWIIPLLSLIVVAIMACFIWREMRNKYESNIPNRDDACTETGRPNYPDIDLTHHISDIAEEMKVEEVIKLVRKLGMSPTRIEEVKLNNYNNVSEQKIKFLECWYQENGRNGAYETLITTLEELHFRATAEKIKQKIRLG